MSQTEDTRLSRIAEIEERIEWMRQNYHGCDWCCGGGDQEMEQLTEELTELRKTPACSM